MPRQFKKGDRVYTNATHPTHHEYGRVFVVSRTRKASERERSRADHIFLVGSRQGTRANWLTHEDDVTPEQRVAIAAKNAERAREAVEANDSAARLMARNAATVKANVDKLNAPPVYGPVMLGGDRWTGVTEDRKPIGSTFTYWDTEHDKYGVLSVVQRTDWVGVRVQRYHQHGTGWSWVINMGGSSYSAEQAERIAEAIRQGLALIPSLGDPRPK